MGDAEEQARQTFSWIWFRLDPASQQRMNFLRSSSSIICQNFIELLSSTSTKAVDKFHLHQLYVEPLSFTRAFAPGSDERTLPMESVWDGETI